MAFHWSLSDSKFSQTFRTLLSMLADFNHAVVWMDVIFPRVFSSSSLFSNFLVTLLWDSITIRTPALPSWFITFSFVVILSRTGARELKNLWNMKVETIPIVIGALEKVLKSGKETGWTPFTIKWMKLLRYHNKKFSVITIINGILRYNSIVNYHGVN